MNPGLVGIKQHIGSLFKKSFNCEVDYGLSVPLMIIESYQLGHQSSVILPPIDDRFNN